MDTYKFFAASKQAEIRLDAALKGFLQEKDPDQEHQRAYAAYLKQRIRPAMERLIQREAIEEMKQLVTMGWFGERELEYFLLQAGKAERWESFRFLLNWKQRKKEQEGFTKREKEQGHSEEIVGSEKTETRTLAEKILEQGKKELCWCYPHLSRALLELEWKMSSETETAQVDGETMTFSETYLMELFGKNPQNFYRGCIHMLLHCLEYQEWKKNNLDQEQWDLACDIAAEFQIDQTKNPRVETEQEKQIQREAIYQKLFMGQGNWSAKEIYDQITKQQIGREEQDLWKQVVTFDDHKNRKQTANSQKQKEITEKWEGIWQQLKDSYGTGGILRGENRGGQKESLEEIQKGKYDYRRFLKQFTVTREEMELDTEQFDLIAYYYGIEWYENLPMIEPLETKEGNRLEELVIVIDTSGSCKKETVASFLGETRKILEEKENFFRDWKVCMIQCDSFLQDLTIIHSAKEWEQYQENLVIQGRGGTDFRPVFETVEELRKKKELKNLKGLLYFTDGDGIYPEKKTDYQTAFVFVKKTDKMDLVPGWARKLLV